MQGRFERALLFCSNESASRVLLPGVRVFFSPTKPAKALTEGAANLCFSTGISVGIFQLFFDPMCPSTLSREGALELTPVTDGLSLNDDEWSSAELGRKERALSSMR